jgi:DHA1 family bicyclomycin/chloramphenicol resistance-like MFS transporter
MIRTCFSVNTSMNNKVLVVLLILATSVSMMSTDIFVPSLPHLTDYFGVSAGYVKLTISMNIAAYCIGTLINGPLSERFGRKSVLTWSMACFVLFSLFCAVSQTIGQLIVARIMQGFSAAAEGVIVLAIIRDVFDKTEQIRVLATYELTVSLTPAVAPIIGGYIYVYYGWRLNFYVLAAIALITTILFQINYQESFEKDRNALKLKEILDDYWGLVRNSEFMRYCLMLGAGIGFYFAFATAGPFILIKQHGLPTEYFGYYQGIMVIAYIAGSLMTARMARSIAPHSLLLMALTIDFLGSAFLLFIVYAGIETNLLLAISITFIAFGTAPLFVVTPPLAMNTTWKRTGPAAALLVSIEMGLGALTALFIGVMHDNTSRPFALVTALIFTGTLLMYVSIRKKDKVAVDNEG